MERGVRGTGMSRRSVGRTEKGAGELGFSCSLPFVRARRAVPAEGSDQDVPFDGCAISSRIRLLGRDPRRLYPIRGIRNCPAEDHELQDGRWGVYESTLEADSRENP